MSDTSPYIIAVNATKEVTLLKAISYMDTIEQAIAKQCNTDIHSLTEYLNILSTQLAYMPQIIAICSDCAAEAQGMAAMVILRKYDGAKESIIRALNKGMTAKYNSIYERALITEKSLTRRIDSVITTISAEKELIKKSL